MTRCIHHFRLGSKDLLRIAPKHILCVVPSDYSVLSVFETIIIPQMQALEQGRRFYFKPTETFENFVGTC